MDNGFITIPRDKVFHPKLSCDFNSAAVTNYNLLYQLTGRVSF